jgi:hypothetical protein
MIGTLHLQLADPAGEGCGPDFGYTPFQHSINKNTRPISFGGESVHPQRNPNK